MLFAICYIPRCEYPVKNISKIVTNIDSHVIIMWRLYINNKIMADCTALSSITQTAEIPIHANSGMDLNDQIDVYIIKNF